MTIHLAMVQSYVTPPKKSTCNSVPKLQMLQEHNSRLLFRMTAEVHVSLPLPRVLRGTGPDILADSSPSCHQSLTYLSKICRAQGHVAEKQPSSQTLVKLFSLGLVFLHTHPSPLQKALHKQRRPAGVRDLAPEGFHPFCKRFWHEITPCRPPSSVPKAFAKGTKPWGGGVIPHPSRPPSSVGQAFSKRDRRTQDLKKTISPAFEKSSHFSAT